MSMSLSEQVTVIYLDDDGNEVSQDIATQFREFMYDAQGNLVGESRGAVDRG